MDQADFSRLVGDPFDEIQQVLLVRMSRVSADGMGLGPDIVAPAVEFHIAALGAVVLNGTARGAGGLVADEEDVVSRVTEHRLQVVADPPAAAHAGGGDDDGGSCGLRQVLHGLQVGLVVVDGQQLVEGQRVATAGDALFGLLVPIGAQATVAVGEVGGQWGVEDDFDVVPGDIRGRGTLAVCLDDLLQFVEQFLGAANTERRDQYGAAVSQGMFDHRLQALGAGGSVFVCAVAIGAFEHQHVGRLGRLRIGQQRRVGRAEVAREDDGGLVLAFDELELDVGGAQDVAGGL